MMTLAVAVNRGIETAAAAASAAAATVEEDGLMMKVIATGGGRTRSPSYAASVPAPDAPNPFFHTMSPLHITLLVLTHPLGITLTLLTAQGEKLLVLLLTHPLRGVPPICCCHLHRCHVVCGVRGCV